MGNNTYKRMSDCPDYLDISEVGKVLGFSRTTIWRLRKTHVLKTVMVGKTPMVKKEDIESLFNSKKGGEPR
jgi:hypothetical protein